MSLQNLLEGLKTPRQLCITLGTTPYRRFDDFKPLLDGGVLAAGTPVWTEDIPTAVRRAHVVQAFAEGIGPILLEGKLLKRVQA